MQLGYATAAYTAGCGSAPTGNIPQSGKDPVLALYQISNTASAWTCWDIPYATPSATADYVGFQAYSGNTSMMVIGKETTP